MTTVAAAPIAVRSPNGPGTRDIVDYYSEAGPDFAAWSRQFNMHFGFHRGLRFWDREAMLERMNVEVCERLQLGSTSHHILDLGCGLGATARAIARSTSGVEITGVTLVPWQVEQAGQLTRAAGLERRVRFIRADYRALPWDNASADAVYALESSCHASGADKADFLAEAARVLKPGGRLVVADGFRTGASMNALVRRCYDTMCRFWRVDECGVIGSFTAAARRAGFTDIRVEDISWRVAPSMAFVPLVVVRFLWREWRRHGMTRLRLENALAPLLGVVVGAARSAFGYYIVSATR